MWVLYFLHYINHPTRSHIAVISVVDESYQTELTLFIPFYVDLGFSLHEFLIHQLLGITIFLTQYGELGSLVSYILDAGSVSSAGSNDTVLTRWGMDMTFLVEHWETATGYHSFASKVQV